MKVRAAAKNLVPTTMELGGKSPMIVFKDADVDKAVEWVAVRALPAAPHPDMCEGGCTRPGCTQKLCTPGRWLGSRAAGRWCVQLQQ